MNKIEFYDANEFGKLTSEKLMEFEQAYKLKLPDDYRLFLLTYNGGSPSPEVVDFIEHGKKQSDIVNYLCGIHEGEYWASLEWHMEMFKQRIPAGFIPFGYDPGGNLFLLGTNDENIGKVYFWDHENEAALFDEEPSFKNMSLITNSFTEFMNQLYSDQ